MAWREARARDAGAATDEARRRRDDELRALAMAAREALNALARRLDETR